MFMTPAKLLFTSTLLLGSIISITSTSWLGVWMGLEINLLSFIPLMTDTKNILTTEASLKYFLIQALGSTMLLFSVVLSYVFINLPLYSGFDLFNTLICSALFLKMGAAPFHFWFPGTMEGLSWSNCIILMTWQKVAPLIRGVGYCSHVLVREPWATAEWPSKWSWESGYQLLWNGSGHLGHIPSHGPPCAQAAKTMQSIGGP